MKPLILASASASRQAMLKAAGVDFKVQSAAIDEPRLTVELLSKGADGGDIARGLAEAKALAVSRSNPGELVLGGDSILALGAELIDKSPDLVTLRTVLRKLSGTTHELISAVALASDGQILWHHAARARMTMRVLSDGFIDDYLAREGEAVLASVGGYHFEGLGAQLFDHVEGDYFTILGLPLLPVLKELRARNWLQA